MLTIVRTAVISFSLDKYHSFFSYHSWIDVANQNWVWGSLYLLSYVICWLLCLFSVSEFWQYVSAWFVENKSSRVGYEVRKDTDRHLRVCVTLPAWEPDRDPNYGEYREEQESILLLQPFHSLQVHNDKRESLHTQKK